MNIISAIKDPNLFRPYLADKNNKLSTWVSWLTALRCLYGLPIKKQKNQELVLQCTSRKTLPTDEFRTALFLTGRRSGKSRIAAIIGAFEAALSGREKCLAPGEVGLVSIVSPSRDQSQIIKNYIRAIFTADLLSAEIVQENKLKGFFSLSNGVHIQILTGDFRLVRGFTQLAVIADEVCFFGLSEESKVRNDDELIRAIRPALLTTKGKLIAISTKYAPKGWAYRMWQRNQEMPNNRVLVWDAPTATMNLQITKQEIDDAIAEDPISGRTEFLNEWREDVCSFIPPEMVSSLVVKGRKELLPREKIQYYSFIDVSGGRNDSATIAIAHKESKVVLDYIKRYPAPFNPHTVIALMAEELKKYGLHQTAGDNYAAEFVVQSFRHHGIIYKKSELCKNDLYLEFLPHLCSGGVELLDDEILVQQLSSLERRTRSGGKDVIDHPQGGHDDVANSVAGVVVSATKKKIIVGAWHPELRRKMVVGFR
ncbi:MAG: hypothetical protein C0397_19490 [Odoribacter sp.]|nr:hypothetical protein [Odoribacter sp.]